MPLLVTNLTGSPVTLAAGNPAPVIPAHATVNVTSKLIGLSGPNYTALQAQVSGALVSYQWTGYVEYATAGLTVQSPVPHSVHATGGADPLTVVNATEARHE